MKYVRSSRESYLIELVIQTFDRTGESYLQPTVDAEDDGVTPRSFKSRTVARQRIEELLTAGTRRIAAYSIRKFRVVRPKGGAS